MFNPKVIAIASAVGFILSFMAGLFSGVKFGFIIFRALGFAVLCGAISVGSLFVYKKFLTVTADSDDVSEGVQGAPSGSVVDITVGEDELVDDDSAPAFYVNVATTAPISTESGEEVEKTPAAQFQAVPMEKITAVSDEKVLSEEKNKESAFFEEVEKPSGKLENLGETVETVAAKSAESVAEPEPHRPVKKDGGASAKAVSSADFGPGLDEFPNFESIANEAATATVTANVQNSSQTSSTSSGSSDIAGQDSSAIAQAIRTALAGDK
ncbi:MAG: hypothetical protein ACTTHG_05620 [Treponemataceae bacterium]